MNDSGNKDSLQEEIIDLKSFVTTLLSRIEILEAENADLRSRLGLNSKNSHKPPSTDGLSKKSATGLPKSKDKKQGGQVGHVGHTLQMVSTPDAIVVHHAPNCSCCHRIFEASDVCATSVKRQVFDIPAPKMFVTEHQLGKITCCGITQSGCFPLGVAAPVQYGLRVLSLASMLNVDFKLPFAKISQLVDDLYGCPISESTLVKANEVLYENMEVVEAAIKEEIVACEVVHFDESGMGVANKLHWFHTACTTLFCYLFVDAHRGKKALTSVKSLLPAFKNYAVHDCWSGYFHFEACKHALCNAHLLRELQALIDKGSIWAVAMHKFILDLYENTGKGCEIIVDITQKQAWIEKYQKICLQADIEEPPPEKNKRGKPKNTKGRNLLKRLIKYQTGWLAFAFEQGVPFSNNMAEQAIRVVKIKAKVAMSFRTFHGAQVYARIQGVIKTLRKHKMNVFQNLLQINLKQTINFTT